MPTRRKSCRNIRHSRWTAREGRRRQRAARGAPPIRCRPPGCYQRDHSRPSSSMKFAFSKLTGSESRRRAARRGRFAGRHDAGHLRLVVDIFLLERARPGVVLVVAVRGHRHAQLVLHRDRDVPGALDLQDQEQPGLGIVVRRHGDPGPSSWLSGAAAVAAWAPARVEGRWQARRRWRGCCGSSSLLLLPSGPDDPSSPSTLLVGA